MRHCSVQVRGLLTRDELDRYNALIEVGHFLEIEKRYDHVAVVQKEIDILILPAIERLKEKSRQRDRDTEAYLARKTQMEAELAAALRDDEDEE
ncbi:hypothetical protein AB4114_11955 [Paenibacillus sp. 2RAB27]|uniref:hypothetical protein n=1 Tax=Paenibacillus sp. 2RAB27 TaxID=3232991 RepID=UPI003F985409